MVKTIWAVACAAGIMSALMLVFVGCASAPAKTGEAKASEPSVAADRGAGGSAQGSPPASPAGTPGAGAVPPAASGQASVLSGPNYRIGPEDVLRVSVWENKELTLDVVVRPDGKISFPLIQDVQAEGLTAAEVADVMHQRLLAFIKDPQVSVIVTQINAPKIYVLGNVTKPGPYPLRSDTTVLQALSLAGGFTPFASPRSIKLVRGMSEKQEVRKINYYDLIDEGGEGNYLLKPGDTIVVP